MTQTRSQWRRKLMMRTSYLIVSFLILNYLYSNQVYNLNNFLRDHPSFPMGFIPTFIIPVIYPIIFSLPAIIHEELQINGNDPFNKYIKDSRIMILLGQIIFSICFLGFLWYLMVNTPGYATTIDNSQISDAFRGYCIAMFIVLGLLGSDELKDLVKQCLGIKKQN